MVITNCISQWPKAKVAPDIRQQKTNHTQSLTPLLCASVDSSCRSHNMEVLSSESAAGAGCSCCCCCGPHVAVSGSYPGLKEAQAWCCCGCQVTGLFHQAVLLRLGSAVIAGMASRSPTLAAGLAMRYCWGCM
jgi:hypothetical protein